MENKERFLKVMNYKEVDRVPISLAGPWNDTIERWKREGFPGGVDIHEFLGVNEFGVKLKNISGQTGIYPPFEEKIIQEDEKIKIFIDRYGRVVKDFKNHTSMPHWIEFPIKNKDDLKRIIYERFNPDRIEERYNEDWVENLKKIKDEKDYLVLIDGGCYYWNLRSLAGVDGASYLFYDAPEIVDELFERINYFCIEGIKRATKYIKIDIIGFGEDIAFKNGPLISPIMFEKFILPRYKKVMEIANSKGIFLTWYDSDGDLRKLLPYYFEAGINCFSPCEVAAGMSCPELRKKFGKNLRMIGGIDKREIAKGKKEIDREIERNRRLIEEGGYIPGIDHSVSSDISFNNYRYYIEKLIKVTDLR